MNIKSLKNNSGLVIFPVLSLLILAGSYFRVFDVIELEALDLRFHLRPPIKMTEAVVLIEIADDTIQKLGRFPFDRSYHALLVKALSEAGAKSIVFDIFFSEPQKDDKDLMAAIKSAGNVYLPSVFELEAGPGSDMPVSSGYAVRSLEELNELAVGIGHINIIPDIDGKFRRVPAFIKFDGSLYPYLSILVSLDYLGIKKDDVKITPAKYAMLGPGIRMPLDDKSRMIVNYSGKWVNSYKHFSYVDILQSYLAGMSGEKANLDLGVFKNKVCIIGLTAIGTTDLHPNPFETIYPAVGIHAEIFNSIVNRNFIKRAGRVYNLFILVFISALVSAIVYRTKPIKGLMALIIAVAAFSAICVSAFSFFGIWIDMLYPILMMSVLYLFLTLHKYISEWKKRLLMEGELQIAKKIQESFLPKALPSIEGFDIAAAMFTARQVGGDLYDFVSLESNELGVMIGDVSGKGVPASLFMAMSAGAFKSFAIPGKRAEEVLLNLNAKLVRESSSNLFVTVYYSIFDTKSKTVSYANGGHLPILHLGRHKDAVFLDVTDGAPLGLMEGAYTGGAVNYSAGDIFVFYTDGVTEAMNQKGDMYGKERLLDVVEKNRAKPAKALVEAIEKDIRRYEPKSSQHDDITLIVLKVN